ncbi:alpha/beta hydrolase [Mycobacterium deserti]|uniref:Alpha/beta hydrolase n=1 Tax=Mycobacterium deserti TaxID=2978347 RepID=A0ABT2MBV6_9MYCO|nr:alpha/beta hydrolase [Mycobacterium deserti]MCT7658486.1 alpha/beta hydrolase [Mycobacterium deserti]
MRRAAIVVVIVTLVASGVLAVIWSQQRRLIYFPSAGPVPPAATFLPNGSDVILQSDDGIALGAWYFPVRDADTAVLVCNGNGGDRSMRVELAAALNTMGLSVLLFDYRGYGGNPGKPTEGGLAADARAAQAWLAAQQDIEKIVYFGESLGGAVAVGLATERPPAALILRSPFSSLPDVAAVHYPWLPVRRLLLDRYPSIDRIGSVRVPLLVIAGDRDDIVPGELSRRLYDAGNEPKKWLSVPGVGHNDPALLNGRQMLAEIEGFLSQTGVT